MSVTFWNETGNNGAVFFGQSWVPPPSGQGFPDPSQQYDTGQGFQMPGGPPPEKKSGWRFVLLGCGCLVVVAILVIGGGCAYFYQKGPTVMADLYEMGKPQLMSLLTEDHTEEQRRNFESALELFIEDLRSDKYDNIIDWGEKGPQQAVQNFRTIQADQKITIEESQNWARLVKEKVGDNQTGQPPEEGHPLDE